MPFSTDGLPWAASKDWPESGLALIFARDGVFALDDSLKASPVFGGDFIGLSFLDSANTNLAPARWCLAARRAFS
jgi:hypothetical protein